MSLAPLDRLLNMELKPVTGGTYFASVALQLGHQEITCESACSPCTAGGQNVGINIITIVFATITHFKPSLTD